MLISSWLCALTSRRPITASRRRTKRPFYSPIAAQIERLEDRTLLSTVTWDGGAGTLNWHHAANWSGDVIPGLTDDAEIGAAYAGTTITVSQDVSVNSITSEANLLWTNGTVAVAGATTIASGATLEIGGASTVTLDGGTLTIDAGATLLWADGDIQANNGAVIQNDGTFDIQTDGRLDHGGVGAKPTLNNTGTLQKTAGAAYPGDPLLIASLSWIEVPFYNTGLVDLQQGVLHFRDGGSSSGDFRALTVDPITGTPLRTDLGFVGSHDFSGDITSHDTVGFATGVFNVTGTYSAAQSTIVWLSTEVNFSGTVEDVGDFLLIRSGGVADFHNTSIAVDDLELEGEFRSTANLDIANSLAWTLGKIKASTTTIAAGAIVEINEPINQGSVAWTIEGGTFENNGTVNLRNPLVPGNVEKRTLELTDGTVFNNRGTFYAETVARTGIARVGTLSAAFNNFGTFTKAADSQLTMYEGVLFENSGTVDVQAGVLLLDDAGTSSGTFTVAGGSSLLIIGSYNAATLSTTSDVSGAGNVGFAGNASIEGAYDVSGTTSVNREGTANFTGQTAYNLPALVLNGHVDFHGADIVTSALTIGRDFDSATHNTLSAGSLTINDDTDPNAVEFNWVGGTIVANTTTLAAGATLEMNNTVNQGGGTFWSFDGGTFENYGTSTMVAPFIQPFDNNGDRRRLELNNGATLNNYGSFTVDAANNAGIGRSGTVDGTFNNFGTLTKLGDANLFIRDGVTFNNSGTVDLQGGITWFIGAHSQTAGTTVLNGGDAWGHLSILGGQLEGTGTIFGHVTNGGETTPGFSPGQITVTGNYDQTATGALTIELGGRTPVSEYDQLNVTGTVTLGGQLDVSLVNGFLPSGGDSFTVVNNDGTDAVVGTFDGLAEGAVVAAGDRRFEISYVGGDGNDVVLNAIFDPAEIVGLVWQDSNNDGQVNFGEKAIEGVTINLTGTDDLGNAVNRSTQTDGDGIYMFFDLPPSDAAGYTISEVQPTGFDDGIDTLGTVDDVPLGDASVNDVFSGVVLQPGSLAENYNFGERPPAGGDVTAGQTATIGFWMNNNGQALIESLNGGPQATQLADWLSTTFVNMYGDDGVGPANANDLTGKTNAQVADFYGDLFRRKKKEALQLGLGGPVKMDAQVLAVALATYVTNANLAGTVAESYGFLVTQDGVGVATFNVGDSGAAFDVADNTEMTILDLLFATNNHSLDGILYDKDGDGRADSDPETLLRTLANDVYSAINQQGDI